MIRSDLSERAMHHVVVSRPTAWLMPPKWSHTSVPVATACASRMCAKLSAPHASALVTNDASSHIPSLMRSCTSPTSMDRRRASQASSHCCGGGSAAQETSCVLGSEVVTAAPGPGSVIQWGGVAGRVLQRAMVAWRCACSGWHIHWGARGRGSWHTRGVSRQYLCT